MDRSFDAIIIGAGPAGSSAAILLGRAGWRVALVEKHVFPRKKVCGGCIAASNLPILAKLGIGGSFSGLAGPSIRAVALASGNHLVRAPMPRFSDEDYPWGVALGRDHLDELLIAQAHIAGAEVFQPWSARSIEGEPGDFRCRIRTVATRQQLVLSAPVLIDAHGSWDVTGTGGERKSQRHQASDLFAFMARFTSASLEPGLLPVLSFPGGYGGMVVAEQGVTTLAFCLRRDHLAQARSLQPGQTAAHAASAWVVRHCKPVSTLLGRDLREAEWMVTGPLRPGIRLSTDSTRAFLIGNAAGEAHPIVGEGISMALQSAAIVADVLIPCKALLHRRSVQEHMHREYVRRWRRRFVRRIRMASLFAHVAMRPGLYTSVLPVLKRSPVLLRHFALWCDKARPGPEIARTESERQDADQQVALATRQTKE